MKRLKIVTSIGDLRIVTEWTTMNYIHQTGRYRSAYTTRAYDATNGRSASVFRVVSLGGDTYFAPDPHEIVFTRKDAAALHTRLVREYVSRREKALDQEQNALSGRVTVTQEEAP